ncbi:MAG: hypothetical protein Tsb004_15600 [Allomuricauda sp.]
MKAKYHLAFVFLGLSLTVLAQKIPITTSSKKALEFYNQGWELEDKLKLDEAESFYIRAINVDSTFALAYLRLGMVKDNYENRRKHLKLALKNIDNVSQGEKYWILGRASFYMPEYNESEEYDYFKKLSESYPEDEIANYLFGYVNLHHGVFKPELAIAHFEKAISLNPNYVSPHNELTYAYIESKNYSDAKRVAKKQLDLLPNAVNPLDTYAEIFMRIGAYQKSVQMYMKVLELDATYPWALMGIAANLNFQGKHEKAREFLNQIEEDRLSDYEYRHKWRALVCSYLDQGDFNGATGILERQKQAVISGINKREPTFHLYYAFLRRTRLFFENNEAQKGIAEYYAWKDYTNEFVESERTKELVNSYEDYYKAYSAFCKGDLDIAQNHLDIFNKAYKGNNDPSKILQAKIHMKRKEYEKAINTLKTSNTNDPYNQYCLMRAYSAIRDKRKSMELKKSILGLNELNNINLALVRQKAMNHKP